MKGTLFANPTFIKKPIKQPTVISIHPLVAYNEHRLYFNNTSIKWDYKDIVNCTFLESARALLVLTDDYKIYVFTEQLQRVTILHNWEPKYIVGFEMLESLNMFLLIGTEEIEIMKVKVMSNIKRTKFLSSMKFSIKRQYHLSVEPDSALKWNRGYGFNIDQDLLYVWSTLDIHFLSLTKLTLKSKIDSLTKKENTLSTVLYNSSYRYTIAGMLNGEVKVWRLPVSQIYKHKEILLHTFCYHSREVQHIIQGADQRTVITAGVDMYVCFLSIETFQLLRIYNFTGQYTKIYLCNSSLAYAIKESYLGQLNFGLNMEFITQVTGQPLVCDRSPHGSIYQQGKYNSIQITLNSNVGIEINLEQMSSAVELNKLQIKNHYPPLKSNNILHILSSPFEVNRYLLLVQDGDIFSSTMIGNAGKIDRHFIIAKVLDFQKHTINHFAKCIRFLHIVPPQIDTELMEKTIDKNFDPSHENKLILYSKLKLLTVGTDHGSILFLSAENMASIYCRLSYHRESIVNIQQIHNKENKQEWLVSVCQEKFLKMVNFEGNKAQCIFTLFLGELYSNILGLQNHMVLVMPKGLFEICCFSSYSDEPTVVTNRESINHEDDILSIDYRSDLKLLVTAAKDQKIKIWTMMKIQLYEINIHQSLQFVFWGLNNHLIIFMNNKIFGLRTKELQIKEKIIKKCESEFFDDFQIEKSLILTQYVTNSLQKMKLKQIIVKPARRHASLPDSPDHYQNKNADKSRVRSITTQGRHNLNKSVVFNIKTPVKRKNIKTEESPQETERIDNDLKAVRLHLEQLSSIKRAANESILPQLKPKREDVFVEFMRQKLLNKKLLTRRDITLNRIIMKNIIKDHLGSENENGSSFKLE